jgi:hypothetical protein
MAGIIDSAVAAVNPNGGGKRATVRSVIGSRPAVLRLLVGRAMF